MQSRWSRSARSVAVVLAALALTGCLERVQTFPGTAAESYELRILTPDGRDHYRLDVTPRQVSVLPASGNRSEQLRVTFWPGGVEAAADAETCATWSERQGRIAQVGAALRIRTEASGRIRAVTLTQNVIYGWFWILNVHVWDTAKSPAFTSVAQLDFADAFRPLAGRPVRVCTRAIGPQVSVKVWDPTTSEPTWKDPVHVRTAKLPAGWGAAGRTGWFAGHLAPGDRVTFTDIDTWAYRPSR